MVLLVVLGPLENLPEGTADRLQPVERIARDHRADRGAADDQHFIGHGGHHRAERAAAEHEAAKHHDEQNNDADNRVHLKNSF